MADITGGRDPALTTALRRAVGDPPYGAVDWDVLARRIQSAAARRRVERPARWWEHAAGWTRAAVPIALAASIAAFALVVTTRSSVQSRSEPAASLLGVVTGAESDQALVVSVGGSTVDSFAAEVLAQ